MAQETLERILWVLGLITLAALGLRLFCGVEVPRSLLGALLLMICMFLTALAREVIQNYIDYMNAHRRGSDDDKEE